MIWGIALRRDEDPGPRLRIRMKGDVTLVDFQNAGVLFESEVICRLFARLRCLVNNGHSRLVLNLDGVEVASGALLGSLAQLHRRAGRAGGFMKLHGLNPMVRHAIMICRLDTEFEIFDGEQEALAAGSEAVGPLRLGSTSQSCAQSTSG